MLTVPAPTSSAFGEQLVAYGLKPDTPVTVSCAGTTTGQQTVAGTLGELELAAVGMTGPVVVTVGKAAAQRDKLAWWESRPLYGWKVLVPRTKEQAGAMSRRLRCLRRGAGRGADDRRRAAAHARPRWSGRSRAWSPAGTSGSSSPRRTR